MRRSVAFSLSLALAMVPGPLPPRPAQAQIVCANCANMVTQLWQYAKEVEQVAETITMRVQQAQMLRNQVTNMVHLPESVWQNISGNFRATQGLFSQGRQLVLNAGMVSGQLQSYTGMIGNLGGQYETYQRWSVQANDNITSTLRGMGLMRDQMVSDQVAVDRIRAQSDGAVGAMQATQANTQMGGAMVNELMRARELIMQQAQMQANALQIAQNEKDRGRAGDTMFMAFDQLPENGNKRY